MRGLCISHEREGAVILQEFKCPRVSPGTALVRVKLAGVCATDLALLSGYKNSPKNMILGHEFYGVVHAVSPHVGGESVLKQGDRVVSEINCVSKCSSSSWRDRAQDPSRTALGIFGANGCFAEFILCPLENLHLIPDSLEDEDAVFVEPLAAACSMLEEAHVRPSDRVAVLGGGKLGTLVAAALRSSNFMHVKLLVSDRAPMDGLGSAHPISDVCKLPVDVSRASSQVANSFQVVIDCTGSPDGLGRALQLVEPRGKVVLKSTYPVGDERLLSVDMSMVVVKEIAVLGSRCGYFPSALSLLESGLVVPRHLIEKVYDLGEGAEAFKHASLPGTKKIIIRTS